MIQSSIASPAINIITSFYQVEGKDAETIQQNIQKYGPVGKDGKHYQAVTKRNTQWNYRWIKTVSMCRITSVEVSVDIEYQLPELSAINALPENLRKRWDTYFKALFRHEQQHKDFGVQEAVELEKELLALNKQQDCNQLEDQINDTARKVLDKYDRIEKEFDRVTNHGINEGVKLP